MLITDINTAGASATEFPVSNGYLQVSIDGTWNGATVELQQQFSDGTWHTKYTFTQNAFKTVICVDTILWRTFTTGSPDLKCEMTRRSDQI